jgi:hypothetical protein
MACEQDYWNQMYANACDQSAPSLLLRPRLFVDGNQWCALYGENLQEGVAGFGDTPDKAMRNFDLNWCEQKACAYRSEIRGCAQKGQITMKTKREALKDNQSGSNDLLSRLDRVGVHPSVAAQYCKEAAEEIRSMRRALELIVNYSGDDPYEMQITAVAALDRSR